jgi:thiamin-phosphate kinase
VTTRLSDIGEFEAIRRILAARESGPGVAVGPGDDAAILRPTEGMELAATTDAFVERVHYHPGDLTDFELGGRFAAANLSDLAAVASQPRWGLISMGIRPETPIAAVVERDRGVSAALRAHDAALVGWNLSAVQGPEWMSLTLIGECRPNRAWTRGGAHPGDLIAITGSPGRAAGGLAMITDHRARRATETDGAALSYATPHSTARRSRAITRLGRPGSRRDRHLGRLAADLGHVCDACLRSAPSCAKRNGRTIRCSRASSECGVDLRRRPRRATTTNCCCDSPKLCGAALDAARTEGVTLTMIGVFTPPATVTWVERSGARRELSRAGYDHYR